MKYVAFLRGVNVGGRVIKMQDLKACLESIGLYNVKTLLQSGNVIFESDKNKDTLKLEFETALFKEFAYPAKVQIYTLSRLAKIVADYPFPVAQDDQHKYVIFMENGLEKIIANDTYVLGQNEKVAAGEGVVYWRVKRGLTLKSSFAKLLTKSKYKDFNTNRNLNTLVKLIEL